MNIKKIIIIAFVLASPYALHPTPSQAINMRSDQYRIQFGSINSGGEVATSSGTYTLNPSIGQSVAKEFQSNGYIVKAGFQYIYSRIPFSFYLSNIRVDFGTLLPNTPSTGAITIKVSFGGAGQYVVTARADAPLTEIQGTEMISFTACDLGPCTITNAQLWTNPNTYGFGYAMAGQDVPTDFSGNTLSSYTYFRPFANRLLSETAATIMQSGNVTADITPTPAIAYTPAPALTGTPRTTTHQAVITMKTNISGVQPAGTYATVIRFLATPSF